MENYEKIYKHVKVSKSAEEKISGAVAVAVGSAAGVSMRDNYGNVSVGNRQVKGREKEHWLWRGLEKGNRLTLAALISQSGSS